MLKIIISAMASVIVFIVVKALFGMFSDKTMFALEAAPAAIVMIYGMGYLILSDISRTSLQMYPILVGAFVLIALAIHAGTIDFFLDGASGWLSIALGTSAAVLASTHILIPGGTRIVDE